MNQGEGNKMEGHFVILYDTVTECSVKPWLSCFSDFTSFDLSASASPLDLEHDSQVLSSLSEKLLPWWRYSSPLHVLVDITQNLSFQWGFNRLPCLNGSAHFHFPLSLYYLAAHYTLTYCFIYFCLLFVCARLENINPKKAGMFVFPAAWIASRKMPYV